MQQIVEYERRISAALKRIDAGIEAGGEALSRALDLAREREGALTELALAEQAREEAAAEAAAAAQIPLAGPAEVLARSVSDAPQPEAFQAEAQQQEPTLARMRERLAEAREREAELRADYEGRLAALTGQLDAQGLELMRMRRSADTLREELRRLHEAAAAGLSDPDLINRAMLAELDALRATRLTEMVELDEIAAALDAHLEGAEHA